MFRSSVRIKILGIAVTLIALMIVTAVLSLSMASRVGHQLQQLSDSYVPAYGHLARANIFSLERAIQVRKMVIAKTANPPDFIRYAESQTVAENKLAEINREERAAQALLTSLAEDSTFGDRIALTRILTLQESLADNRRLIGESTLRLLAALDTGDAVKIGDALDRVEELRDELTRKMSEVRTEMQTLVHASTAATLRRQEEVRNVALALTALAAVLGLGFAFLVSGGVMRPVRRLVAGARAVEAGRLDDTLPVTSKDEIGQLTGVFNRMVEQLRLKERIRETFGKYIDPQVVEGLIDRPALGTSGQRRVMTVLFCDLKGFTSVSEGMTPQGLVKIMNRYLTTMSEAIRNEHGVIDKYIGDAIMAYWGPPFNDDAEQAKLACFAATDMAARLAPLRAELPDLLGVRKVPMLDIRIGIATGEALVGSIGSDLMMSYTVMGDTVNLASRLEGVNKLYGTRMLVSNATAHAAGAELEMREIDRVVVLGKTEPEAVYEVMARAGGLTPARTALRTHYAEGLAAYRLKQWEAAARAFAAALQVVPDDGPSLTLLKRLEVLQTAELADDWDGAWHLDQK